MQARQRPTPRFDLTAVHPRLRIPVRRIPVLRMRGFFSQSIMKQSLFPKAYRKGMLRGLGGRLSGRMAEDTESSDGVCGTADGRAQPAVSFAVPNIAGIGESARANRTIEERANGQPSVKMRRAVSGAHVSALRDTLSPRPGWPKLNVHCSNWLRSVFQQPPHPPPLV
jgi:hypothetical protein